MIELVYCWDIWSVDLIMLWIVSERYIFRIRLKMEREYCRVIFIVSEEIMVML